MPLLCPGCRSEIDPAAAACPLCLRPRTRQEIMAGLAQLKDEASTRRRRPFVILLAALLAAGGAWGLRRLSDKGIVTRAKASAFTDKVSGDAMDLLQEAAGRHERVNLGPSVQPVRLRHAPPPALPPSLDTPAKPLQPVPSVEKPAFWTVGGPVYSMLDLRPAGRCALSFKDRTTGRTFTAKADDKGTFSVRLPTSDEGYDVSVTMGGSPRLFIEDNMVPFYRDQPAEARKSAAEQLKASNLVHVPILLQEGSSLDYPIALLP